jgi:hypothetical protein
MDGDLREDHIGQNFLAGTHDRSASFVAGAFDTEDVGVWHNR